jgi:hypothetical protein
MSGAPLLDGQAQVDQQDARVDAALQAGWSIRHDPVRGEYLAARELVTSRTLDELLNVIEAPGELRVVPGGVHAITPKRGTAVSVRTGLPADLTDVMSFPSRRSARSAAAGSCASKSCRSVLRAAGGTRGSRRDCPLDVGIVRAGRGRQRCL